MKKVSLFIVIITVITLLALSLTSCQISYKYDDALKYTAGGASISAPVDEIEIDWLTCKVEIEQYDGDEIIFKDESEHEIREDEQLHYYLDGSTLKIKYAKSGVIRIKNEYKTLVLMMPRQGAYDIEVNTVSANVYVNAPDMELKEMSVNTVSGNVEINSIIRDELSVATVSGDVSVKTSGSLNPCEIETVSGNVKFELPRDASFVVEYDTVSGSIENDFQATQKGNQLIYAAGVGSTTTYIEVDTVSGNITLKAQNQQ